MKTIDVDLLQKLLRYDPETGKLFWLPREKSDVPQHPTCIRWNSRYAGREAFTTKDRKGYLKSAIFNVMFRAHRIAWALFYGVWPDGQIDHINMDRADNRICNLREANNSQNNRNRTVQSNNKSGYKGVFQNKKTAKWCSVLMVNGEKYWGGTHSTAQAAAEAYSELCRKHHGEFARTH